MTPYFYVSFKDVHKRKDEANTLLNKIEIQYFEVLIPKSVKTYKKLQNSWFFNI